MLKNPLKTLLDALINHFTKERLETLILTADEELLTFMLEDKNANDYKNAFFKTIANSLVFNQKALLECLTKELENSFTRFENKIGLYLQGDPKRPIKSSGLVVLNFPFKDNVLLGNAKDNSTKSNELFYHEILHKKEIDTLLHKMDEIFGRENFVASLHAELSATQGMKVASAKKGNIVKNAEYILIYSKNMENFSFIRSLYVAKEWDEHYSIYIDPKTKKRETLLNFLKNGYENITKDKIITLYNDDKDFRDFIHKNANNIYRDAMIEINFNFTKGQESSLNNGEIVEYNQYLIFKNSNNIIRQFLKLSDVIGETDDFDAKIGLRKIRGDWWGGFYKDMMNINKEANLVWKAGKKPERLIRDILEISTQENDLVLDFFAGSGTTCAVAHKMKRRYIGIEQMDYIETITKERLKKVIEGEQGGISKKCDFKGGGSFVYAELKEVNLEVKKQILNAKSASECLKIFNDLNERFLRRADCKIDEIHSEEFQNLDLNEQKRICCTLLDSNEDYLNLGDINEDTWGIDGITKKYNEIFYS